MGHTYLKAVYNYASYRDVSQVIFIQTLKQFTFVEKNENYPHYSHSYPQNVCDKVSRQALIFQEFQLGLSKIALWIT